MKMFKNIADSLKPFINMDRVNFNSTEINNSNTWAGGELLSTFSALEKLGGQMMDTGSISSSKSILANNSAALGSRGNRTGGPHKTAFPVPASLKTFRLHTQLIWREED
ncbi:hypothetical protein [Larkinella ripae]